MSNASYAMGNFILALHNRMCCNPDAKIKALVRFANTNFQTEEIQLYFICHKDKPNYESGLWVEIY